MNNRSTQPPARPSRTAVKNRPAKAGFTSQQVLILTLVGVLGLVWLALAGFVVVSLRAAPAAQAPALNSPPETVQPAPSAQVAIPLVQGEQPSLPAGCRQANAGFSQGTTAAVLEDGTLDVRVGENRLAVTPAGITLLPGGPQAVEAIRSLVEGKTLVLLNDQTEQDTSGRSPRYIFADGLFVNYELVRQGYARTAPESQDRACATLFLQTEQIARMDHIGLWKPTPAPTATFMPFVTLDPSRAGCDCSVRYECSNFQTRAEAQTCYNACNDYNSLLDSDRDGLACEGLP